MPTPPNEVTLLEWPSTSTVWQSVMEKLQPKTNLPDHDVILSWEEALSECPNLTDLVNEAIKAYRVADYLYQFLDEAQSDIANSVTTALTDQETGALTRAIKRKLDNGA